MDLSVEDQLTKLEAARILVLRDSALYTQIVQGILPIIGANARIEIRRWGAEFLAETFASPMLALQQKERLAVFVLQTLKQFLEIPGDDNGVVKSVVQAATSIYGLIFRYMYVPPSCRRFAHKRYLYSSIVRDSLHLLELCLILHLALASQTLMTRQRGIKWRRSSRI